MIITEPWKTARISEHAIVRKFFNDWITSPIWLYSFPDPPTKFQLDNFIDKFNQAYNVEVVYKLDSVIIELDESTYTFLELQL